MIRKQWFLPFLICITLFSCGTGEGGSPIVAKFRDKELRLNQLILRIPKDVSSTDSARHANLYIEQWLREQAVADVALQADPGLQERVEFKVADYRAKLIMHEFTARIVRDSLDTLISDADVMKFFVSPASNMQAKEKLYSYFYVVCTAENTGDVDNLFYSSKEEDINELRKWVEINALEYKLDSQYVGNTIISEVAKGYYGDLKSFAPGKTAKWNGVIQGQRRRYFFKMIDSVNEGDPLPLALAGPRIRNNILNERKGKLIEETEKRIVQSAQANNLISR